MRTTILSTLCIIMIWHFANAQCPNPNPFQLPTIGSAASTLTPVTLNETVHAPGVWAGHFITLNVEQGQRYKVSQLNSEALLIDFFGHSNNGYPTGSIAPNISFKRPQVDHDPMLTIYDNTGGTTGLQLSGNIIAFNEDASATEKLAELEFIAPYTGNVYIAIDLQPGTVAYNTGNGTDIQIQSAPMDCGLFFQDSTVVSVTKIPNTLSNDSFNHLLIYTTSLYPNPSNSGEFKIKNTKIPLTGVSIHDVNGRIIYQTNFAETLEEKTIAANLTSGIYFIQVHSQKGSIIKKLVIN